ncbi:MAG: hypothetical protein ACREHD_30745 [Pirellulales bacterium]
MYTAFRTLAAILAGLFVALVLVVSVELFSAVFHPLPEDFGGTTAEMCRHVERYPQWVLGLVVVAWAVTAAIGTWTAMKMGNLCSYAMVGLVLLAALVFNVTMLPYPLWFKIVNLLVIPAAIIAGGRLSMPKSAAGGEPK